MESTADGVNTEEVEATAGVGAGDGGVCEAASCGPDVTESSEWSEVELVAVPVVIALEEILGDPGFMLAGFALAAAPVASGVLAVELDEFCPDEVPATGGYAEA